MARLKKSELAKRENFFKKVFQDKFKLIKKSRPYLWSQDNYNEKIKKLESLGFCSPAIFIKNNPRILNYSIETLKYRIKTLKDLGFKNPVRMITRKVSLVGKSSIILVEKIEDLRRQGFEDPCKILEETAGGLSAPNVRRKIIFLKKIGFSDPILIITKHPGILNLSTLNVKNKMSLLRNLFPSCNCIELVERYPTTLSMSQKRILLASMIMCNKKVSVQIPQIDRYIKIPYKFIDKDDLKQSSVLKNLFDQCFKDKKVG